MNIIELLKDANLTVTIRYKKNWMYWDTTSETWIVRGKTKTANNTILENTNDEELAVRAFISN